MPTCFIIAGPNGAGKTTFALNYLQQLASFSNFINVDLIASGLSPLNPDRKMFAASRLLLNEITQCIAEKKDFAFETTLSGRTYLKLIKQLRADNWYVELIYLALPSAQTSIERVAERVSHGGHNVKTCDILRRFSRSLHLLFNDYSLIVNKCACYLNNKENPEPVFVQHSNDRQILHHEYYQHLMGGQLN